MSDQINHAAGNDRITGGSYMPCAGCGRTAGHAADCALTFCPRRMTAKATVDQARGAMLDKVLIDGRWVDDTPEGRVIPVPSREPTDAEIMALWFSKSRYPEANGHLCEFAREVLAKFAAPPEDASDGDLFSWKDFYVDSDGMLVIKFQPVIRVSR